MKSEKHFNDFNVLSQKTGGPGKVQVFDCSVTFLSLLLRNVEKTQRQGDPTRFLDISSVQRDTKTVWSRTLSV